MKKLIFRLLGIDPDYLEQIREYNSAMKKKDELLEFNLTENKIRKELLSKKCDKELIEKILETIRNYSEEGFPINRYKELSNRYQLWDNDKYKAAKEVK